MIGLRKCLSSLRNRSGSATVEFALGGSAFITMLIGILQVGIQVQNYNALRSVAYDVSRYVVVEYQKSNKLTEKQIIARASSVAVRAPYLLNSTRLDISVTSPTSRITGATEFNLQLGYDLPTWLAFVKPGQPRLTYDRSIFVPA